MEETIEMILTEQTDLNGALDVIDKELDKVLQNTGIYIGTEEKENIYKTCNALSKNIDNTETLCLTVLKQIENKDSENNQDVVHTIDVFLETLD